MERARGAAGDGRRRSTWGCCFCIKPTLPDDGVPPPAGTHPVHGEGELSWAQQAEPGTLGGAPAELRALPAAAHEWDTPEKPATEEDLPSQDPAAIVAVLDLQEDLGPLAEADTRPDKGEAVMHHIPQLKLAPIALGEVPRPSTPPILPHLPYSHAPIPTPRGAQADVDVDTRKQGDGNKVQADDQTWVDSSAMELIIEQTVAAIRQCILVTHWTSSEIGCLITLESAPDSPGMRW